MTSSQFHRLLQRAGQNDEAALGELLGRYRGYIKVLSRRFLDDCGPVLADASDIVQQTCVAALKAFPDFRGESEGEFIAWLRAIHQHAAVDHLRRSRAQKRGGGQVAVLSGDPSADQSSPSRRLMQGEAAVELASAIEQLPDDLREAVRLRHLEGWSLPQIAEHMGRSHAAAAGLVKRGLSKLRADMKNEE
ncbi:MAG: RNA polymerase subunit sigma-70 [Planctomycetota bacterium]|nr:MAG: RNA polymerase subunit sigma-70 [Planctomycetota bacterium]